MLHPDWVICTYEISMAACSCPPLERLLILTDTELRLAVSVTESRLIEDGIYLNGRGKVFVSCLLALAYSISIQVTARLACFP